MVNLGDLILGLKIDNSALKKIRGELSSLEAQAGRIKLNLDAQGASKAAKELGQLKSSLSGLQANAQALADSNDKVAKSFSKLSNDAKKVRGAVTPLSSSNGALNDSLANTAKTLQLIQGPLGGVASRFVTFKTIIKTNTLQLALFTAAVAGLSAVLKSAASSFLKSEANLVKLENTILSTGRAFEITAGQADKFAQDLARNTLLGLGEARDGLAQALTFDNIPTDQIERFGKITADVAAGLNKDFKGTATSIAKALQAPASALDGLGRAGVFFSKKQRKVLQDLVDTGKTGESTAMILGVLEKRFKGIATARGASAALDTLNLNLELFRESIFSTSGAGKALEEFINALSSSLKGMSGEQSLATRLGAVFAQTLNAITAAIGFLADNAEGLKKILKVLFIAAGAKALQSILAKVVTSFTSFRTAVVATRTATLAAGAATSKLAVGLKALGVAALANPIVGLSVALALVAVETGLADKAMSKLFNTAKTGAQIAAESNDKLVTSLGELAKKLEDPSLDLVKQASDVRAAYSSAIDNIAKLNKEGRLDEANAAVIELGKNLNSIGAGIFQKQMGVAVSQIESAIKLADKIDLTALLTPVEKLKLELQEVSKAMIDLDRLEVMGADQVDAFETLGKQAEFLQKQLDELDAAPFKSIIDSAKALVTGGSPLVAARVQLVEYKKALDELKGRKIVSLEDIKLLDMAVDRTEQLVKALEADQFKRAFDSLESFSPTFELDKLRAQFAEANSLYQMLVADPALATELGFTPASLSKAKANLNELRKKIMDLDKGSDLMAPFAELDAEFRGRTNFGIVEGMEEELRRLDILINSNGVSAQYKADLEKLQRTIKRDAFNIANPLIAGINEGIDQLGHSLSDNLAGVLFGEENKFQDIAEKFARKRLTDMIQVFLFDPITKDEQHALTSLFEKPEPAKDGEQGAPDGLFKNLSGLFSKPNESDPALKQAEMQTSALNAVDGNLIALKEVNQSGFGGLGGALSSLMGAAQGLFSGGGAGGLVGTIAGLFGGARAKGGPVNPSQAFLVGEQGPELFMPKRAGDILNAGQTGNIMNSGGNDNRTVNVVINAGENAKTWKESRGRIESSMKQAMRTG